ncbi:hypothetical protein FNV43_RR17463 [Rhamnella rubrinervis]|uniref:UDP-glycosyltransferase 91A1 n=1 Tax=Rhamnella rubrinervis TaxID=2594499 RepID=A0A8K0E378_9ROSA|nr:hypothetical protein FNV43_RR17463 [Rhamnella rubrinervis]
MAENKTLHIVLFPWLAFGHMIPYLKFAKLIAQKGHRVSFLCTPRNIDNLPKIPPNLSPLISFVKLSLPHVENLPDNAEATVDLPSEKIEYLKKAYDMLNEPVTQFLQTSDPDWVIYDFAAYWLGPIAARMRIKTAFFGIFSAACLSFLAPTPPLKGDDNDTTSEDFTAPPEWIYFHTKLKVHPNFESKQLGEELSENYSGVSVEHRFRASLENCDTVAIRSCLDFETEWFQLLRHILRKPVLPVGLIPPSEDENGDETETWKKMKEWLDKQETGSVVYVSFGTEAKLKQEEINAVALGLEHSQLPFFWVLRTHSGSAATGLSQLPEGFEERTKGRGVMWNTWAPQLKILAHDSVGGYLAHSGWSSLIESIHFQKPMILLTFVADQGINAKILEKKKLGYSIPRNKQDGLFSSNAVADSLRLVMIEDEGKIYRERVKEMSGLFADKDKQNWYLDNFLDYLKSHTASKSKVTLNIEKRLRIFPVPPKWIPSPTVVAYRYFEIRRIIEVVSAYDSGVSDLSGLFPPAACDDGDETETWSTMKLWLDNQEQESVVCVAFGTEAKLGQEEITSVALGLEESQLPFFWVLRTPSGSPTAGVSQLPEGFEERTRGRGVVWNTWASQLKILAHDSVGRYLAHSGWSSVVESVTFQKPMILLTFVADRGINARILEERKMGSPYQETNKTTAAMRWPSP